MNLLIVEDEPLAVEKLEMLLAFAAPEAQIAGKTTSIKSTVKWLTNHSADLIFMDIQLADGMSFSIFDQVEVTSPVIFTTAFDQYAIQAFKQNSIDYLLKPIDEDELKKSIAKFEQLYHAKPTFDPNSIQELLKRFSGKEEEYTQRFMVYAGQKLKSVQAEHIAYFFAHDKAVFLTTFDNRTYTLEQSLDQLVHKLDPGSFHRANRKFIVNIKSVEELIPYSKSRYKLELQPAPQFDVFVSVERLSEFKYWMGQ